MRLSQFAILEREAFKQKAMPRQIKMLKCKIYFLIQALPVQHLALCLEDKGQDHQTRTFNLDLSKGT